MEVLVVGELNLDLILNGLERFPETGKEILANDMVLTMGSSSAIFACNLSALGTAVGFAGKIGRDIFGDRVLSDLGSKRVDTRYVIRSEKEATGLTVAFSFREDRSMVTYPGAMSTLEEKDITAGMLQSAGHLHLSSLFLQPGLQPGLPRLLSRARDRGLTISLDPQWDPAEKWDCDWQRILPLVDLFLPNREEIKGITGKDTPEAGIAALKNISNVIIVKNGRNESLMWTGRELIRQAPFLNDDVVDAIGAGDSFDAGFVSRFIRKRPLAECLEFAALCGAINTTAPGGTTAFTDLSSLRRTALEKFNYQIHDL